MKNIPHNQPSINGKEVVAVNKVLKSKWLIQGEQVRKLEKRFKKLIGSRYALAVNSGVSALHLSLISLDVEKDDEVILPTYTCTALLNAVNYIGATPVLVDVEINGFNIDSLQVKNKLTQKTKAIIVPHMFGFPAKIKEIKRFGVPVIEDCAQALGSNYKDKMLGSFGDISIFSLYATKMIASGQGGVLVTNKKSYFNSVNDLIHYDQRRDYKVRYNYQLTDIIASIANAQLSKLDFFIKKRRYIASFYRKILDNKSSIDYWPKANDKQSNYYRFILRFKQKSVRDAVKNELKKKGITPIIPIAHYQLLHNYLKIRNLNFPNATGLSRTTLSLPIYPGLEKEQLNRIASALDSAIN